jgi:hypothetical protein
MSILSALLVISYFVMKLVSTFSKSSEDEDLKNSMSSFDKALNSFDFLSDIGGFIYMVISLFSMLVRPVAEHQFVLKTISKLMFAQTKDNTLFNNEGKESESKEYFNKRRYCGVDPESIP